jgi:hypothetical protein
VGKEDVDFQRDNVPLLRDRTGRQVRPLSFDNVLNELVLFMAVDNGLWVALVCVLRKLLSL